jgi:hypothetical protein
MTQLPPDELEEIERKVARYRAMVTKAAERRFAKRNTAGGERLMARRTAVEAMKLPETKIAVLRRYIAGESLKTVAADYHHSVDWIRHQIDWIVSEQMESSDPYDDEWHRQHESKYRGPKGEWRRVWCPLALERLMAARPR